MKDFNYYLDSVQEIGYVEKTTNAIIHASGLPNAKPGEIVVFENGELGQILGLTQDLIEILIFSVTPPRTGDKVARTNQFLEIPVGTELLGNVISPLGYSLENLKNIKKPKESMQIYSNPEGILKRKTITRQLETGVSIVDLVLPIGYGQRELVIGDRKTGKTNFLLQTVITQAKKGNICVYAAIGKKMIDIKALKEFFAKNNILKNVVIVASGSEHAPGITYIVPYSAMTIAEYFRDSGKDVLLILDDLSVHAKFYREISLLGKRFPGRNSYPGDIFFRHAALLERGGNFITEKGERAITCLPVVETAQGDLSGYIQTNLMSMTDGHLYFDSDMFTKGQRPAINPFLSVTRVGRQTQTPVQRQINREVLSFLTLFEKMQNFSHFGAELSESTKITLSFGEGITKFFEQRQSTSIPINMQIFLFCLLWNNILQKKPLSPPETAIKLINSYESNKDTQTQIDTMIKQAESFNQMLGIVSKVGNEVLQKISLEQKTNQKV